MEGEKEKNGCLIGLCGGYCAGKNAAAAILEEEGFLVLDLDKLGHRAIVERREAILARFGPGISDGQGGIDRRALGHIVFKDKGALADLEGIVHPAANALAEAWVGENRGRKLCLNAALLHRMGLAKKLDYIIEIRASLVIRLRRAAKRDGLGLIQALRRIVAQGGFSAALKRLGPKIFILSNNGSLESLHRALRGLLSQLSGRPEKP